MLYVAEAEALAYLANITIRMYRRNRQQYVFDVMNPPMGNNPTQQFSVSVFHQGVHFSRFNDA